MGPDWRARDILPSEQNSERNIIKKKRKSAAADFFLNFAAGKISLASANITSPKAKYHSRVARISLRPTGAAPFGRGVKEQKPPTSGGFTPSKRSAGRRPFEAQNTGLRPETPLKELFQKKFLKNPQKLSRYVSHLSVHCPLSTNH